MLAHLRQRWKVTQLLRLPIGCCCGCLLVGAFLSGVVRSALAEQVEWGAEKGRHVLRHVAHFGAPPREEQRFTANAAANAFALAHTTGSEEGGEREGVAEGARERKLKVCRIAFAAATTATTTCATTPMLFEGHRASWRAFGLCLVGQGHGVEAGEGAQELGLSGAAAAHHGDYFPWLHREGQVMNQ